MKNRTKSIALGGILTALSVILLYIAGIVPSGRILFLVLASLPVAIMTMEEGLGMGFLTYGGAGLLFFLLTGNLKGVVTFGLLFGVYPIIKYKAEQIPFVVKEFALKYGFFNLSLYGMVTVFRWIGIDFMMLVSALKLPFGLSGETSGIVKAALPYILFIFAQGAFLVYDYGLSVLIVQYLKRIKKEIPMKAFEKSE